MKIQEPEYYSKKHIDECLQIIADNEETNIKVSKKLVDMMSSDRTLKGHSIFYTKILEAIFNGEQIDYPEKEQFLILYRSLIKTYNEINR